MAINGFTGIGYTGAGTSGGLSGVAGPSGTSGPNIGDIVDRLNKKYANRFSISVKHILDGYSAASMFKITDISSNVTYSYSVDYITDYDEIDSYINELIIDIRDKKINQIVNE